MSDKEEVKEVKKKVVEYKLVEIPSSYGIAIQTPEEEILTMEQSTVKILNLLNEIKKLLKE